MYGFHSEKNFWKKNDMYRYNLKRDGTDMNFVVGYTTLKKLRYCRCCFSLFHLSKFLSMIIFRPRSAREVAFQTFPFAGAPASTCKKPQIGDPCHLHLLHKLAVGWLLQVCLQVESATDSGVSDDGGEDLRAVDLLSPPPALPKHVSWL